MKAEWFINVFGKEMLSQEFMNECVEGRELVKQNPQVFS